MSKGGKFAITAILTALLLLTFYEYVNRKGSIIMTPEQEIIDIATAAGGRNNPGNIRFNSANAWLGKIDHGTSAFECFSELWYGYRALLILLRNSYNAGNTTISEIINIYAPSADNNNPDSYSNYIATGVGIGTGDDCYDALFTNTSQTALWLQFQTWQEQGQSFDIYETEIMKAINNVNSNSNT